ncbi:MAG: OsmC family protein [Erysipelotrichaceae bacterium]|nr:OsmC family protein [Erysipelotrichaceae bacterium]
MAFIKYENGFHGTYDVNGFTIKIGREEGSVAPYDMTYGAIASCLYATYLDLIEEKHLVIKGADIDISGIKREMIPTTLEELTIKITVYSDEELDILQHTFNQALATCSMVQTFKLVATIHTEFILER